MNRACVVVFPPSIVVTSIQSTLVCLGDLGCEEVWLFFKKRLRIWLCYLFCRQGEDGRVLGFGGEVG